MTARSAAERARAWRQRQHDDALDHVLGLLATLPEVAIAQALGRLTTGQLHLIGHHLVAVCVRAGANTDRPLPTPRRADRGDRPQTPHPPRTSP